MERDIDIRELIGNIQWKYYERKLNKAAEIFYNEEKYSAEQRKKACDKMNHYIKKIKGLAKKIYSYDEKGIIDLEKDFREFLKEQYEPN